MTGALSLLTSILGEITIAAVLGLSAACLARRSCAAARHSVLATTLGVVLILPIASLLAPPIRIPIGISAPRLVENQVEQPPIAALIDANRIPPQRNRSAVHAPAFQEPAWFSFPTLLLAGWITGTVFTLLPVIAGLWQIHLLRRSGVPWTRARSIVEPLARDSGVRRRVKVLLHHTLPGPMTCGVMQPAIVLPRDAKNWEREDLHRAIVHEMEHVRRCDWLTQCVAKVICALYWFHPLVWIAWRRLSIESERACDDAVLRRSEPTAYAGQLLRLARRISAVKSPVLAMANRSDLATRIGAVLDASQRRGRAGKSTVSLACGVGAILVFGFSPVRLTAVPQPATAKFEVASVRKNMKWSGRPLNAVDRVLLRAIANASQHGRLRLEGIPLNLLIQMAYNVKDFQVHGEPSWASSDRFNIEAKADGDLGFAQMRPMLQTLLMERFKLSLHRETRELPVYELVAAKQGMKIYASTGNCKKIPDPAEPPPRSISPRSLPPIDVCGGMRRMILSGFPNRTDRIEAVGFSMPELVGILSEELGRTVIDKTGFKDSFDFTLNFVPDMAILGDIGVPPGNSAAPPSGGSSAPSIFEAMREQLGLGLRTARAPVEILVIDNMQTPSEN